MWSTYLCLLLLAFTVSSGFFALNAEAAYQNLSYTSSGSFPYVGYWQLAAVDNYDSTGNVPGSGRTVSAYTDFTLKLSNSISNLDTSWPNPYYVQFRQTVKFLFAPGIAYDNNQGIPPGIQYEPQFELVDVYQTGYFVEDARISDSTVVELNGTSTKVYLVTLSLNYTYINGARTGNPTPITDFKIRAKESFIFNGYGDILSAGKAIVSRRPILTISQVSASYGRQRDVSDYEPFVQQNADNLQSLVDGIISDQVAADALDQANDNFVQEAGALQSGQAVLEGAADNSMAAVDFGQVDLIDTYSGSVNFWMSLINQLPSILGAFWSVLIFALIIAFVLFIVRIRR